MIILYKKGSGSSFKNKVNAWNDLLKKIYCSNKMKRKKYKELQKIQIKKKSSLLTNLDFENSSNSRTVEYNLFIIYVYLQFIITWTIRWYQR